MEVVSYDHERGWVEVEVVNVGDHAVALSWVNMSIFGEEVEENATLWFASRLDGFSVGALDVWPLGLEHSNSSLWLPPEGVADAIIAFPEGTCLEEVRYHLTPSGAVEENVVRTEIPDAFRC